MHPYVRRRLGDEPVTYLHPLLEPVLARTLGVPIFQEQLMQVAMAVGGCTGEDADLLRRAMGSKRGIERIESLKEKLYAGMASNGIDPATADEIYLKIQAFANFGFAESHSLSFGLLVYASAWMRLHYPGVFLAALLRAQPMGFYSPASLTADARRHGVEIRRPDINASLVDPTLEPVARCAGRRRGCRAAPTRSSRRWRRGSTARPRSRTRSTAATATTRCGSASPASPASARRSPSGSCASAPRAGRTSASATSPGGWGSPCRSSRRSPPPARSSASG